MRRGFVLGVAIGADAVRVLLLSGGLVVAVAEHSFGLLDELRNTTSDLLNQALRGRKRYRRVTAVVSLGPATAHVRRVTHDHTDANVASGEAGHDEYAMRYFLGAEESTLVTSECNRHDGVRWTAAFDRYVVEAVSSACQSAGIRVKAIVPAAAVLNLASCDRSFTWVDGELAVDVVCTEAGELASVRRRLKVCGEQTSTEHPAPPLAALGEHGWQFADAYGAAASASSPRTLQLDGALLADGVARDRQRVRTGGAIAATMLLIAALSPGLSAHLASGRSERELGSLEATRQAVTREYQSIAGATATLRITDSASSQRRSMTLAVAALTRAIPDSVHLTDVRLDALGGTITAIGPHAAAVVEQLTERPFAEPSLVGAVTTAGSADTSLERATIRFKWARNRR